MARARIHDIPAGREDRNDHDTPCADPVFKLVADRSPDDDDLASQPTLSRFENAISIKSLKRLRDVFLDQFIASFDAPPRHLTFDLDAVDDPAHGHQQLTFWRGYHDQNQYLPLVVTCANNDRFVMLSLRPGNVPAALPAFFAKYAGDALWALLVFLGFCFRLPARPTPAAARQANGVKSSARAAAQTGAGGGEEVEVIPEALEAVRSLIRLGKHVNRPGRGGGPPFVVRPGTGISFGGPGLFRLTASAGGKKLREPSHSFRCPGVSHVPTIRPTRPAHRRAGPGPGEPAVDGRLPRSRQGRSVWEGGHSCPGAGAAERPQAVRRRVSRHKRPADRLPGRPPGAEVQAAWEPRIPRRHPGPGRTRP
jgi:hypothetical protein